MLLFYIRLAALVELGEAPFAGLPEAVVKVDAGLLHGPAHHVIADVPGAGEEVA